LLSGHGTLDRNQWEVHLDFTTPEIRRKRGCCSHTIEVTRNIGLHIQPGCL
jgi:hypothetical protein